MQGPDGWLLRWSPEVLFPELGPDGDLRLDRDLGPRGRIVGIDGTVWAETREDGARVYPQEALAGQTIGYVTEVTAEDLESLAVDGYLAGDVVGRSGLESGLEDVLRGTPGWRLVAVTGDGAETVLYETEMVPGADATITLDPELQAVAENGLAGRPGASAVVDPTNGDVWALASGPAFNPNSMTIGTTVDGVPLAAPDTGADHEQGGARRVAGGIGAQAIRAGRRTRRRRGDAVQHAYLPAHLAVQPHLHVPQLRGALPARAGDAGPGHGVQLQHDLHAARL